MNRKPDQNTFIERFNKAHRTEGLSAYVFESLDLAREIRLFGYTDTMKSGSIQWRSCPKAWNYLLIPPLAAVFLLLSTLLIIQK